MAPGVLFDPTIQESDYYSESIKRKFDLPILPRPTSNETTADIQFHPNLNQYLLRLKEASRNGRLQHDLPSDWPQSVDGNMNWTGSVFDDETRYVYRLSTVDLGDLKLALRHFKDLGLQCKDVDRRTFPLPNLGRKLVEISEKVYNDIGFMVLRGLNVDDYTDDEIAIIFLGISSYIADKRGVQDRNGNVLKHLLDGGKADSQFELPFHTDVTCDVVATLVKQCSSKGGTCNLASAWTVYNDLAAARPDLLHVLAKPNWPFDTFGRNPPYYNRAILHFTTPYSATSKPILNFSRRLLTGHPLCPRSPSIPSLNSMQAEALDAVHFVAAAHQLKIPTEKGDIRYINNLSLLHGREAFFDEEWHKGEAYKNITGGTGDEVWTLPGEKLSRRHLLRLWLSSSSTIQTLPPPLKLAWARVFDDDERLTRCDVQPIYVSGIPMWRSNSSCD